MLSARYNGDAMPLSFAVAPVELAETSEPQLPWVRRAVSLQDYRSPAQRAEALPPVGSRVVTRIARSLLPANDTPRALLAAVAARFAEFVAAQAGGQAVQLCVPAQKRRSSSARAWPDGAAADAPDRAAWRERCRAAAAGAGRG